ncbi:hypothetical protein CU633_06565 [Bacillus sp. V3-13]|uniref:hypothetical protein n=1 Tax=Bacillus sp. V3-13 TaxID=2053728 RepID=UPI000C76F737|nr:hypothetical protein [Bacillus sp. V3-13]PLR78177.1 hypothetical protein CU633_06565 [Bacillus sp. V3-13]
MNLSSINKMLQELRKTPFIESNVTHRISNQFKQVVSLTYCRKMKLFQLHEIEENKFHEFAELEETAAYLSRFINRG